MLKQEENLTGILARSACLNKSLELGEKIGVGVPIYHPGMEIYAGSIETQG